MIYDTALVFTCSVSLIANIFLIGFLKRYKHNADFWHEKFHDAVRPVVPPPVQPDPYEQIIVESGYDWEESWD